MFFSNVLYLAAVMYVMATLFLAEVTAGDCAAADCPPYQACLLQVVWCKRAPCPPVPQCVDKTEYICYIHKPCLNGGKCHATRDGDYNCTCAAGYTGESCQHSLVG